MASVFGYAGLKSKLSDWREHRSRANVGPVAEAEPDKRAYEPGRHSDASIDLSLLLENLVIPKLIAGCNNTRHSSRSATLKAAERPRQRSISAVDVIEFTRLCVSEDAPSLLDFVERFLSTGSSVETIYIELLAPSARKLGEYWEADSEDFVGVTMGLWRIQEVLRELTLRVPPVARAGTGMRSALFSTMPGEQHSFGTLMVAECFERAGWQADVLIEPSQSELTGKFARHHYDLIGLTVSRDCSSAALSGVVAAIRAVSSNPHVKVLVGGRAINEQPELAGDCGADGTAIDASSAVMLADRLVPVKAECLEDLL
jgi:MerR family transcriptional regulator, light-induced transcriptional regulator